MAGEHYFSARPTGPLVTRTVSVRLAGRTVDVTTAGGVFSPDRVDTGTQVLLASVPAPPPGGDLLDLGCGWGPVALTLALESPRSTVWAVDVNERALDLVRRNARSLGLDNVNAVLPQDVPDDVRFRTIWSNPPIRVGKNELHALLEHWMPRLAPESDAWLVVQRNLGSDSLHRWMQTRFESDLSIMRAATSKGFRVLRARRRAATGEVPVAGETAVAEAPVAETPIAADARAGDEG
jgi:16S rRNA (guanine1207-N2)-methyltransferase